MKTRCSQRQERRPQQISNGGRATLRAAAPTTWLSTLEMTPPARCKREPQNIQQFHFRSRKTRLQLYLELHVNPELHIKNQPEVDGHSRVEGEAEAEGAHIGIVVIADPEQHASHQE